MGKRKTPEQRADEERRYTLAQGAHTEDEFEPFFSDPNQAIRNTAAMNPDASAAVLARFAQDRFWSVRIAVAEHPNTSTETLLGMLEPKPPRRGVVHHAALERLERDGVLVGERLVLTPLTVSDAEAMTEVLADPELYRFTGGEPPSTAELTERYERQVAGPPAPSSVKWFNWIARLDGEPIGYIQATMQTDPGAQLAELAWVIGTAWQGSGFAAEGVSLARDWLAQRGVTRFIAAIHPEHRASERLAERVGLTQTGSVDGEGERIWESPLGPDPAPQRLA